MNEHTSGISVRPPLDASEVAFLATFAAPSTQGAGHARAARAGPGGGGLRRVWPGQPRTTSPWTPCAQGCCLVAVAGVVEVPGAAAQWMRFLLATFLGNRHRVHGGARVRVRGRPPELVMVDGDEVFEGLVDQAPQDPLGG